MSDKYSDEQVRFDVWGETGSGFSVEVIIERVGVTARHVEHSPEEDPSEHNVGIVRDEAIRKARIKMKGLFV